MALVYVDTDPWLTEHEACEKLYREIMEQLTIRGREQRTSYAYARLSSSIRFRMRQYSAEVQQLKEKLSAVLFSYTITVQEIERRSRQVELLESREIQLHQLFNDRDTTSRSILIGKGNTALADAGLTGWGVDDDSDDSGIHQTQNMNVPELRQEQQKMVQDQEKGLEALSKVISRQKVIAETIGSEVDLQNEIIDDLAEHIEHTDNRVRTETRQVTVIDRKDKTCWYWVVIILLFIAILIIAFV